LLAESFFGAFVIEASDFIGSIDLHEKISQNKSDRKGCQNQQREVRCEKEKEVVHPVRSNSVVGVGVDHEGLACSQPDRNQGA
jgi:hypothetical protein